MSDFPRRDCDAVRELLSAQLDGELPELETALLDAHLWHCAECSAWARGVDELTRRLREAPLELPTKRLVLPSRTRRRVKPFALVAASAAAIMSALAFGLQSPGGQQQSALQASRPAAPSLRTEQRMLDRLASLNVNLPSPSYLPSSSYGRISPI